MAKQAAELRYAVRMRVLCKYFGQLCLLLAALTVVPLAVSLLFGDTAITMRYATVVGVLLFMGAALARLRAPARVQANEGMVLAALLFLFTPVLMSYPLMGSGLDFADALLEAVSGVTTTGLSTKATLIDAPPSFLFARAWMQWYGGLGIVFFSLALVLQPGLVAKGLAVADADSDDLVGGTRAHARRGLIVYTTLTVLGIIGCLALGVSFFDAVLHTFAALSTGSFASHDGSLAVFALPTQIWISLLCVTGAIPLTFWYRILHDRQHLAVDLLQIKAIFIAAMAVSLAVAITMRLGGGMAWPQLLHHAPLLAFSAQTTAGFSSMACAELDAGSKLMLILAMLVGGGAGSTAGGFKLLRLLIVFSVLRLILLRTCLPKHAVIAARLAGYRLQESEIQGALLLIVLFAVVVLLSWLPFVAMGFNPLDTLFEVVSATATVGLSVGVTQASLPPLLKGILCLDMLLGRVEIIAWLLIIYPGTWFGRTMEE